MTHKWNYLPITSDQAEASQRLAQELGISPVLGELLVERGITTAAETDKTTAACPKKVFPPATTGFVRPVPHEGYGRGRRAPEQGNGKERAHSDLWRL